MLETINNEAARIISGEFHSSPINSLLAESNLVPLNVRKTELLMNYISKVPADKNHQNYKMLDYNRTTPHSTSIKRLLNKTLIFIQEPIPVSSLSI